MNKKSFKNSPALNFITPSEEPKNTIAENTLEESHDTYVVQNTQDIQDTKNIRDIQDTNDTQDIKDAQNTQNIYSTPLENKEPNGKKKRAQKLPRMNIAFSEENYEYLHLASRIYGKSATAYINYLIEEDRKEKSDVVEQAKSVLQ